MPVTAVPCQAGSLKRYNCADSALTDGCQQLLKSRPRCPTAGFAKVIIHNPNVAPTELPRSLNQAILPSLALRRALLAFVAHMARQRDPAAASPEHNLNTIALCQIAVRARSKPVEPERRPAR